MQKILTFNYKWYLPIIKIYTSIYNIVKVNYKMLQNKFIKCDK